MSSLDASLPTAAVAAPPAPPRKPFYANLWVQVLVAIALAVLLGHFSPAKAIAMKPLGDAFIRLITMVITLIIFCTVVSGIAGAGTVPSRIRRSSSDFGIPMARPPRRTTVIFRCSIHALTVAGRKPPACANSFTLKNSPINSSSARNLMCGPVRRIARFSLIC
jgi:hypothetical protein